MEKPCGLTVEEVRLLRDRAESRRIFAAVPLVQTFGPLAALLEENLRQPGPRHLWFRFIAGPPSRYPATGSAWMLDPTESGGGCFINLSGHFIELALRLLPDVVRIWAGMSNAVYGERIEDYAMVTLEGSDGSTATVETGYLFPSGTGRPREVYFSSLTRQGCQIWWGDRAVNAGHGQPWGESTVNLDSDPLYHRFVAATLEAFRRGAPPPVGLDVMVRVMEVIDAAYRSARSGQPVAVEVVGLGAKHG
jgi:predicted dehydrogenase